MSTSNDGGWGGHTTLSQGDQSQPSAAGGSREVRLDELSKYFHLPEKAVAKELGICLTSLKKLCRWIVRTMLEPMLLMFSSIMINNVIYCSRSYGITRWPFRKLKSLERTMKKVQTEQDAVSTQVFTVISAFPEFSTNPNKNTLPPPAIHF
jgi:hypothetical protein